LPQGPADLIGSTNWFGSKFYSSGSDNWSVFEVYEELFKQSETEQESHVASSSRDESDPGGA